MNRFQLFLLGFGLTLGLACASAPSSDKTPQALNQALPTDDAKKSAEAPAKPDLAADMLGGTTETSSLERTSTPTTAKPAAALGRPTATPTESNLKAGFSDDNREFNYFLGFLEKYGPAVPHQDLQISERILLKFTDGASLTAGSTLVEIRSGDTVLEKGTATVDGQYYFYPDRLPGSTKDYAVSATYQNKTLNFSISRNGARETIHQFPAGRKIPSPAPVDIVFALDTTGSMGEEIERLKTTIELINLNLTSLASKPLVRFGLVLYKDRGDEYVTKVIDLTANLDAFQAELAKVEPAGGGDTPEDMVQALADGLTVSWDPRGVKQLYIITDAPPHAYPDAAKTYADLAQGYRARGIKVFSVGTGGLPLEGEYPLRQIAQFTGGKYIFLTYGEKGESAGGEVGTVSHHSGANFQTDKLESIIIRFAKEDIQAFTGIKDPEPEDYFEAHKAASEDTSKTLEKLFTEALAQLVSFSSLRLDKTQPIAILNLANSAPELAPADQEFLVNQLLMTAARNPDLALVDRKELDKLLQEMEFTQAGLADEKNAPQVGKLLGAKILLLGSVFSRKDQYEIFLKLVRVETGEILALTKIRLGRDLLN